MLNMAINIDRLIEYVILIKFKNKVQFGVFLRGHLGTPIDPAPVLLSGKPCSTRHYQPLGMLADKDWPSVTSWVKDRLDAASRKFVHYWINMTRRAWLAGE